MAVYAYCSGSIFPNNVSASGDNYWVDVVFNDTSVNGPQANNDSGFIATENTALSIPASALLANDTDPDGLPLSITGVSNPINGTVSYNASTQTVTFVPCRLCRDRPVSPIRSRTAGGAVVGQVSITVELSADGADVVLAQRHAGHCTGQRPQFGELGVKFQASTNGTITGHPLLQGPAEHRHPCGGSVERDGHFACHRDLHQRDRERLAAGQLLHSRHRSPRARPMSCPTTPTATTPRIRNYFATALTNGSLTALASGTSGGDGVYAYGTGSIFPTNSFSASNYWVDVVFNGPPLQPPVANNDSGFSRRENTTLSIPASALLANDTDPNGLPLSITG